LCRDSPACFDRAITTGAFDRALRGRIGAPEVELLRKALYAGSGSVTDPGSVDRAL
jgi:hypothetical protein